MDDEFYMVSFEATGNFYFFHDHEDACAFLLESYFDDFDVETEDEVTVIYNEVADYDGIDGYACIDKVFFTK